MIAISINGTMWMLLQLACDWGHVISDLRCQLKQRQRKNRSHGFG